MFKGIWLSYLYQSWVNNAFCIFSAVVEVCTASSCGVNAECITLPDEKVKCICLPGHTGNPNTRCQPIGKNIYKPKPQRS